MPIYFWGAGAVFAADRLTKVLAVHWLDPVSSIPVWPGVFHWTLVHNTGVAFGLFKNFGMIWIAVPIVSAAAILFYLSRHPRVRNTAESARLWAWAMIAGGALGNAYDRVRFGAVIDFLDFRVWPVFNLADSAIVCGAFTAAVIGFLAKENTA